MSEDEGDPIDYETERVEPAGLPIIEGDSDVGIGIGVVLGLTRFGHGQEPYIWGFDLVATTTFKDGPNGIEVTQYHGVASLDVPGLWDGRLRISPLVRYERTINSPWFGRGNASAGRPPPDADGEPGRYFQYIERNVDVRNFFRFLIKKPYEFVVVPELRYAHPTTYRGSRLELDRTSVEPDGRPTINGVHGAFSTSVSMGIMVDTRDNEFFPRRGWYNQFSVRATQGYPLQGDIRYFEAAASIAGHVPIGGPFIFAARGLVDVMAGKIPFYDLIAGGPFVLQDLPGGSSGIRGIPVGRYAGQLKFVATAELRALFIKFGLIGQHFRIGASTFFDTGRVWDDWTFASKRDGTGLGMKWGTGAGLYLLWGETSLVRIDAAYAPEAKDENPSLPFAFYFVGGTSF
jgi:hypothetical protein